MTQQNQKHLLMHRPHLLDLPKIGSLPDGYALQSFTPGDDWKPLALTLSLAFNDHWDENRIRIKLLEDPSVRTIYSINWQGYLVATASSRWLSERFPQSGYVHWVGTHPDHRAKGLASILIVRLLQEFLDREYKDAVVETDDFRIAAIKTYLKFGFIPLYDVGEESHQNRWSAIFQAIFGHQAT